MNSGGYAVLYCGLTCIFLKTNDADHYIIYYSMVCICKVPIQVYLFLVSLTFLLKVSCFILWPLFFTLLTVSNQFQGSLIQKFMDVTFSGDRKVFWLFLQGLKTAGQSANQHILSKQYLKARRKKVSSCISISFYLRRKSFPEHPSFRHNRLLRLHEPDLGHMPTRKPVIDKEEWGCCDRLRATEIHLLGEKPVNHCCRWCP